MEVILEGKGYEITQNEDGSFSLPKELERLRGLGTQLKPSWEPALIARKPIVEKTVAKQVLKTGTGAMNIDACRVRVSSADLVEMQGRSGASSENAFPGASDAGIWEPKAAGRWPANILLTHGPSCRLVGTTKVKAPVINRFTDGAKPFGNGAGHAYESEQRGDAEGKEEIAVYECVEPHTIEQAEINGWCIDITHAGFDEILGGFDRLQSLLADIHIWDTGNTQLNEPVYALLASSLQGLKGDCPACSRFYGERFLSLQEAALASVQQLGDALGRALGQVRLLRHNQRHQHDDLQTNDGVSPESSKCESIASSKSLDASSSVGEMLSHTSGIESGGCLDRQIDERLPNNTSRSSILGGVRQVSSFVHCNACNDTELRLFFRESLVLASRFLPGCVSIRTFTVSGCPVKALDDQSGVLKTSGGPLNRAGIGFQGGSDGNQDYVPPSEGGASRFFPQFEQLEAPFMYQGKVSKRERDEGLPKGTNNHPCLHPDALVLTDRGYEAISTIEVGRRVYAADGRFHTVEHASSHPYTSTNLFSIFVRKAHEPTLASDNHPFLIWRPTRKTGRVVGGEVMWLRADQIQRGDYTMTPILKTAEEGVDDLPSEENFWYVFGLYLAEGVLQKAGHGDNAYPSFSLHKKEFYLIDRIRAATNCRVEEYPREGCAGTQVVAFDPAMGKLFKHLGGSGAATKVMAPEIWSLPEQLRIAIFAGWLDGDGGYVRSECQGKTVSLRLASQLQLLGESIGYRARINRSVSKPGSGIGDRVFKSTRPCYQLNFYTPGRQRTTSARAKRPNPHSLEWDGTLYSLRMVKRVEQVPYDGLVYNLSVSGSPTFQTVVGMSHNTVKPQGLMRWLVRLVTPAGGTVLDPYAGSGSTLVAALKEGFNFIGIERDPEFHRIAKLRVEAAMPKGSIFDDMEDDA